MQPPSTLQRSAVLAACVDMIRACGLTLAEVAQQLGEPLQIAPRVRAPRAPKPSQRKKPALSEQAQQVLALADRPNGAIVKEFAFLLDVDYSTAAYHCDRLVGARRLTKVKVRGEHAFRYWSNPAHALAYVEAKAQEFEQQQAAEQQAEQLRQSDAADRQREAEERATAQARQREERAAQAAAPKPEKPALPPKKPKPLPHQALTVFPPKPPPEEAKPRGEAIRTEKTVETRDTTVRPTAKWQMQQLPPDPRYPSFASMRPGVNPDTGKAWGERA